MNLGKRLDEIASLKEEHRLSANEVHVLQTFSIAEDAMKDGVTYKSLKTAILKNRA